MHVEHAGQLGDAQHFCDTRRDATQLEITEGAARAVQEPDQQTDPGAVDGRHPADIQDHVWLERQQALHQALQLVLLGTADDASRCT